MPSGERCKRWLKGEGEMPVPPGAAENRGTSATPDDLVCAAE
jgi:hypothetical protein